MVLEALSTADEVFDALGGSSGICEITSSKPSRVANWRALGSFPPNTYGVMSEALRERGKTAPMALWRMMARAEAES
jgi:hypothetical protein